MSKSGKIAYVLFGSSLSGAIWYTSWGRVIYREQFQVLFLIGFLALAVVSGLVYWSRRATVTQTRKLNVGTLLSGLGMVWIATGLAGLSSTFETSSTSETGALIFALTVGPLLVLIGIIAVSRQKDNENAVSLGGDINSERQ